jgi:hypothetical protein
MSICEFDMHSCFLRGTGIAPGLLLKRAHEKRQASQCGIASRNGADNRCGFLKSAQWYSYDVFDDIYLTGFVEY